MFIFSRRFYPSPLAFFIFGGFKVFSLLPSTNDLFFLKDRSLKCVDITNTTSIRFFPCAKRPNCFGPKHTQERFSWRYPRLFLSAIFHTVFLQVEKYRLIHQNRVLYFSRVGTWDAENSISTIFLIKTQWKHLLSMLDFFHHKLVGWYIVKRFFFDRSKISPVFWPEIK